MSTSTKKPTLADVSAASGGVHRNTVSKILSGTYKGDPDTIADVQRAAKELGYSLAGKESTKAGKQPVEDSELPEGVTLIEPEIKVSRDHKWTLKFAIEVACEWDYDEDDDKKPIPESIRVIATEMRNKQISLPSRPTLHEVEQFIARHKALEPEAV